MLKLFFVFLLFTVPLFAQFDGNRAFEYLEKQVDMGTREPGGKGHEICLKFLKSELRKSADKVTLQSFPFHDTKLNKRFVLTNVIASFNPQAKKRIFFAAHWDTRPRAEYDKKENREKPIPGANDGASGVAVLLEMALQLKENPPQIGIDLIFFDGEDYGEPGNLDYYFLGSRYFAKNAKDYKPLYGILLDMIGDANLNIPKEGYSQKYLPQIVDKVWQIAHSLGYTEFEERVGNYIDDDHVILIKQGIPCIDVIDFAYPDHTHRYWHTLQDTPDKCSVQSLETIGNVMMEVIYGEQ